MADVTIESTEVTLEIDTIGVPITAEAAVSTTGSPASEQVAVFSGAATITGYTDFLWGQASKILTAGSHAINFAGAYIQPTTDVSLAGARRLRLDADGDTHLSALVDDEAVITAGTVAAATFKATQVDLAVLLSMAADIRLGGNTLAFNAGLDNTISGAASTVDVAVGGGTKLSIGAASIDVAAGLLTRTAAALELGAAASSGHGLGSGDVIVGGGLELDGPVHVDGTATFYADAVADAGVSLALGTGASRSSVRNNSGVGAGDFRLSVGSAHGRNVVLAREEDAAADAGHAASTGPRFYFHAPTPFATSTNLWGSIYHDGTFAILEASSSTFSWLLKGANLTIDDTVILGFFSTGSSGTRLRHTASFSQLLLELGGSCGNNFVIGQTATGGSNKDFHRPAQFDPTVWLFGNINPFTAGEDAEHIKLQYDSTADHGTIGTGKGPLWFDAFTESIYVGGTGPDTGFARVSAGLAKIVDSAGDSAALTVNRPFEVNTATIVAPHVIDESDAGRVFSNVGASAQTVHELPTAAPGIGPVTWYNDNANGTLIRAAAGDTIRDGASVSPAAGQISTTTQGDILTLYSVSTGEWIVMSKNGAGWATGA